VQCRTLTKGGCKKPIPVSTDLTRISPKECLEFYLRHLNQEPQVPLPYWEINAVPRGSQQQRDTVLG